MANCRILYLAGELHTGGLERQLYYLLRAMDRTRYRPAVAVWNYRPDDVHVEPIRSLGVPLYWFPQGWSSAAKLVAFRRLVGQLAPEVVHASNFYVNFAGYFGAFGTAATAVGSVRNDFVLCKQECGPIVGRLSGYWPRHQVSNSSAALESARRSRSVFVPEHLHVVRNALDLTRFPSADVPPGAAPSIVGIGYLLPAKRWDRLLDVAATLKRRGLDYVLRIAGDGPLLSALTQQARALDVTDRVAFLGHVADIPQLLKDATFVVHTADNEGCPNAVMEAMASGRAVVSTDAGDVPCLVDDGVTGFVVRRGDDETLTERIIRLIGDRALCRRMGEAARMKAAQEFQLERLVTETFAAYRTAGWSWV
jgi:glycosyltransferase involved in cell wall biosynthesis